MSDSSHMYASTPKGKPSLRAAYEAWLKKHAPAPLVPTTGDRPDPAKIKVGIVGGGMAGLYSALLLRSRGVDCHIFEASPDRLGGRVYTHRFNDDPNQYFEAGAMRLPDIEAQQPVFHLVDYLNAKLPPEKHIKLIDYVLYDEKGNLVYVNGKRGPDGQTMTVAYADQHPETLDFPLPPKDRNKTASQLLNEAIGKFEKLLAEDFDAGFALLMKYDNYSMYTYLTQECGWSAAKVNYVETMTSQTNQFQNSFTELVIENMDFSNAKWKTIEHGMDRLPNGCADLFGREHITMGTQVHKIENLPGGKVAIHHTKSDMPAVFDRVIMAIPPAALRMIQTPQWSVPKMHGIRAMHYEPLYKIGLRFKSRFWEHTPKPSNGGQSITDLPSRWCVYPSYGIGDNGKGVLLLYSWMTDAYNWLAQSQENRVRLALDNLNTLYNGQVDVYGQYIESFDVAWSLEWATGDAMFFPGQFRSLFAIARQPEGHVYFAGEHLSVHHTWIVGALDSALLACQQLLHDPHLKPLRPPHLSDMPAHDYDYSSAVEAATPEAAFAR